MIHKTIPVFCILALAAFSAAATEYHIAPTGSDTNDGSAAHPFKTISAAAERAQPGDTITVHEGIYRECVTPARGGESDKRRIVYQAAPGEKVEIKGSEIVKGWEKVQDDTWKAVIPNTLFGAFNPYSDLIHGDWFDPKGRDHHTGAVYLNGDWLMEAATLDEVLKPVGDGPLWFGQVDNDTTTIWAQFKNADPNRETVEINVRQTVFYPAKPGVNFITVRGFTLRDAATPWAPPTAEQIGLIGTHWSKGWIIESNMVSHSKCVGIALGKYGDQWDNTSANTAEGYVLTIQRALENGWSKQNIGHHIVRNNTISHCEQAGIVGSLGAVFCRIYGNTIHDVHVRRLFGGAEMAGIKIHGAIDTEIRGNRIYRTILGIWLDWMAQGTRVTSNLLYENAGQDLFVEVNHGPFVVDNNVFLSETALLDMSEGGAYVHNLIAGTLIQRPELSRSTPFHKAHSTELAGLEKIQGGDDRFYNNIFVGHNGLAEYDKATLPIHASGNVYLKGAAPSKTESDPLVRPDSDPAIELRDDNGTLDLHIAIDPDWFAARKCQLITTKELGVAKISGLPYVNSDDSPLRIDKDYVGKKRAASRLQPGPFQLPAGDKHTLRVWPLDE
ncbi:MAG: right-handed parallel beta-helix repeat-containing protein [Candidatus Hydrogenedentes bacterium]|nr:right-handed parallel beta-helix repeat-containing protein [Candidatus Hydrogenedentota bacterium]